MLSCFFCPCSHFLHFQFLIKGPFKHFTTTPFHDPATSSAVIAANVKSLSKFFRPDRQHTGLKKAHVPAYVPSETNFLCRKAGKNTFFSYCLLNCAHIKSKAYFLNSVWSRRLSIGLKKFWQRVYIGQGFFHNKFATSEYAHRSCEWPSVGPHCQKGIQDESAQSFSLTGGIRQILKTTSRWPALVVKHPTSAAPFLGEILHC